MATLASGLGEAPPEALYVHFPFCAKRCHYCDFSVKRSSEPPVDRWLAAIEAELGWWFDEAGWELGRPLDTVFVGGGTPSLLGGAGMAELGRIISGRFDLGPGTEWTAEANPASFDRDLAAAWRSAGVNRVSLGVQSLDDTVLDWLGRLHDTAGAYAAVEAADAAGFDRVSIDVMFGLPSEVVRDLDREIEAAIDLGVSHVSLYGLTVEPRTPLAERVRLGRTSSPDEDQYADEYRRLASRFRDAGFDHYEVSNFARSGAQCRHNWYYWNRRPYLAVGPSSHGFFPPIRTWNVFRWDWYERALRAGHGPLDGWEQVTSHDASLERIWLGLRTERGLSEGDDPRVAAAEDRFEMWADAGWVERIEGRWVATAEGWLRMDAMTSEISGESKG